MVVRPPRRSSPSPSGCAAFAELRTRAGEEPNAYFELTTAAAFAFFADQAVNAAVLEVGLGGRLDATNVVDAEVCVLTSIGIEHTEYLGEDVATIAGEKLAIAGQIRPSSVGRFPTRHWRWPTRPRPGHTPPSLRKGLLGSGRRAWSGWCW